MLTLDKYRICQLVTGVLRVAIMYDVSSSLPPIVFSAECCLLCRPKMSHGFEILRGHYSMAAYHCPRDLCAEDVVGDSCVALSTGRTPRSWV
jgi:hypothetical protein